MICGSEPVGGAGLLVELPDAAASLARAADPLFQAGAKRQPGRAAEVAGTVGPELPLAQVLSDTIHGSQVSENHTFSVFLFRVYL